MFYGEDNDEWSHNKSQLAMCTNERSSCEHFEWQSSYYKDDGEINFSKKLIPQR